METSDLLMGQLLMRVVWRFAGMRLGVLSVMTSGLQLMQKLPADSWDTQQLVNIECLTSLSSNNIAKHQMHVFSTSNFLLKVHSQSIQLVKGYDLVS